MQVRQRTAGVAGFPAAGPGRGGPLPVLRGPWRQWVVGFGWGDHRHESPAQSGWPAKANPGDDR
jgi:hypothetical protein